MFLHGDDSENEDEEALQEERRRVLSNSGAQLSRINLQATSVDDDEYEIVQRPGHERSDEGRGSSGTLSAKAGVILVCSPSSFALSTQYLTFIFCASGDSQHFHCRSTISCHWIGGCTIRPIRPPEARVTSSSRTYCTRPRRSHQRHCSVEFK